MSKQHDDRNELIRIYFGEQNENYQSLDQDYFYEIDEEEWLKSFFVYAFNFCGCGCLYKSIDFLKGCLDCFIEEDGLSPHLNFDLFKRICHEDDGIFDFTLHWLDAVGLTEHGGSVYGSWLTEEGKAVKKYLDEHWKNEEEDAAAEYCRNDVEVTEALFEYLNDVKDEWTDEDCECIGCWECIHFRQDKNIHNPYDEKDAYYCSYKKLYISGNVARPDYMDMRYTDFDRLGCKENTKELYLCDPEKNKECTKEMCHIHGGLCSLTTDPNCSYTKANGEPIKEE